MKKSIKQILALVLCVATMITSLPLISMADGSSVSIKASGTNTGGTSGKIKTVSSALSIGFMVIRIFSAGKSAYDAVKDGKTGVDIASAALYGMFGQEYIPDGDTVDINDYFSEIISVNTKIQSDLSAINSNITALADKMLDLQQEEYVNSFLYDYVDGGYIALMEDFYTEYSDFIYYLQDSNTSEDALKKAYDELYTEAERLEKFLNIFLTKGVLCGGNFTTIQQLMYNTLGEESFPYVRSIYETYMLAQYCLQICHIYQIQYCADNSGDYSVSGGNSFSVSGVVNRIIREEERYAEVTRGILSFFADIPSKTAYIKAPGAIFVNEINTEKTVNISSDYQVYMNTLPNVYADLFDADLFSFVSSDPAIATVDNNGLVKIKSNSGDFSIKLVYQYDDANSLCCYETSFHISNSSVFSGGNGGKESPFVISTAQDLVKLGSNSTYWSSNYYFVMKNDIDVSGYTLKWIGTADKSFDGHFDGNGYTIKNAKSAIFGFNNGVIENLALNGSYITSGYQIYATYYVGALVIENSGTIRDCRLTGCTIDFSNPRPNEPADSYYLHYSIYVGGVCGYNTGTIERCSVYSTTVDSYQSNYIPDKGGAANDIKGYVGAIAGYVSGGKLVDCLSDTNKVISHTKSISYYICIWYLFVKEFNLCKGYAYAGGIAGYAESSTLTRCVVYSNTVDAVWNYSTAQASGNTNKYESQEGASYKDPIALGSSSTFGDCHNYSNGGMASGVKDKYIKNGWTFNSSGIASINAKGSSVSVVKEPYKTIYSPNEPLSTTGLILKTNTGRLVADGYSVKNFDSSVMGDKTITAEWNLSSSTYKISVSCDNLGVYEDGHIWDNGTVLIPSTHLIEGLIGYTCLSCGAKKNQSTGNLSSHIWGEIEKLSDTKHYRVCPCGEVEISDHVYGEWYVVNASTCENKGVKRRNCTSCEHYQTETIDALNHKYSYKVTTIPQYNKTGALEGTCSQCSKTVTVTLPAFSSSEYTHTIVKEPQCTTKGSERFVWKNTSYGSYGFVIPISAKGHNIVCSEVTVFGKDLQCRGIYGCTDCDYTEEKIIDGFFNYDGALFYCVDGYLASGWFTDNGKTYYALSATNAVINFSKNIGGKYYVWNSEMGLVIADGFVNDGTGIKCYENGVQVIGWRHEDGSGPKLINGTYEQYSQNPEGLYYFLSTTGYMVTEASYKLGGYIREFNDDHSVKPLNGLQTQGGELYYYVDGVKQTGWHEVDGLTYYFRASDSVYGRAATKWMYIGNKIYYFYASTSSTPYAHKDSGAIGGITYTYHEDGYIIYNGFVNCDYANAANSNTAANIQKKNGTARYYINGEMQTGWQQINGKWYYFYAVGSANGSGYMCTQSRTIGGVWYEFTEDGVCTSK